MPSNAASVYIPVSYGGSNTEDSGTTHAAVLDRYGNMACATPSGGGFVKSVFLPELGASLSTRIEMFNFLRNHPNELEPGKRPRTTLVNYIVAKNGVPVYTIGCPGGDFQAQANLQLILNIVVFGMDPQEAIEVPRFGTLSVVNSFHPHVYYPARLALEPEFPKETVNALISVVTISIRSITARIRSTGDSLFDLKAAIASVSYTHLTLPTSDLV